MKLIEARAPQTQTDAGVVRRAKRLGAFRDREGHEREVVCLALANRSRVVIDCAASSRADQRLVAHLGADEPAVNARLVATMYLEDESRGRCRSLRQGELETLSLEGAAGVAVEGEVEGELGAPPLVDAQGHRYGLTVAGGELRWCRGRTDATRELITLRQAIGSLERYEPPRALTARALAEHESDPRVSTYVLRRELERLRESPVVLNRGLREAVLAATRGRELTLSEIAMRCGRVKRDHRGNESGETSWLGRRIGLLPEAGEAVPTMWVHSSVLALIARRGLGVAPREVELG